MNTITLNHMEDSFICANHPVQNYSKFAYLKVGAGDCERGATKSLIKFDFNKLNYVPNTEKIVLELYVKNVSSNSDLLEFAVYNNENTFLEEYVTWQNTPNIEVEELRFSVNANNVNSYIEIDITNIVKEWIKGNRENYGLTLISKSHQGEITFTSSRGYHSPKLKIYY